MEVPKSLLVLALTLLPMSAAAQLPRWAAERDEPISEESLRRSAEQYVQDEMHIVYEMDRSCAIAFLRELDRHPNNGTTDDAYFATRIPNESQCDRAARAWGAQQEKRESRVRYQFMQYWLPYWGAAPYAVRSAYTFKGLFAAASAAIDRAIFKRNVAYFRGLAADVE